MNPTFFVDFCFLFCNPNGYQSSRHTVNSSPVNSSHTRLITQSTRHKWAHNKAVNRNFLSARWSGNTQKQCSTRTVTGQHAETPTRGLPIRGLDNSRTGHLADWSTRGLDNSHTGQVTEWTTRGCHRWLCVHIFRSFGGICETASCPVRKLTSPRDVQSASWRIRELSSYHTDDVLTASEHTTRLTQCRAVRFDYLGLMYATSKSPTMAKLLNATNARRSKCTVNSSQRHQTRRSTHRTILRYDELIMWPVDWFPSKCTSCLQCFDAVGWAAGRAIYTVYILQACLLWRVVEWWDVGWFFCVWRHASAVYAMVMCLSLCHKLMF